MKAVPINEKIETLQWAWLETRMDKRSAEGGAEEWRKQWLSGQPLCRSSTGAALRGGAAQLLLILYTRLAPPHAKNRKFIR